MAPLRDLVLDQYAPLSHKRPLGGTTGVGTPLVNRGWMSDRDKRRLTAYMILEAYRSNNARRILQLDGVEGAAELREYGDAALIVKKALAALLGRSQEIVVEGADQFDPNLTTELVSEEDDQPEGEPADENRPTEEELADNADAEAALEMQDFLRDWADKERFTEKLLRGEGDRVHLGDGVYLLLADPAKGRVRCTVMDPGWYFPVLSDDLFDDFPSTIHFAWEIPSDPDRDDTTKLRRITLRLGPIEPQTEVKAILGLGRRRVPIIDPATGFPVPQEGDMFDPETSQVTRQYPWEDKPSSVTCYMTDATWELDVVRDVYKLTESGAEYATTLVDGVPTAIRDLDLRIDFIPVIHEPNTPAGPEHFGQSVLADVLQLLDDVMGVDTDQQASSATTGLPIIGVPGSPPTGKEQRVEPGGVWYTGDATGGLSTVDTSNALRELRETSADRRQTLSVNSRLPEAFLGRIKASDVPSGYALELGFTPLDEFVGDMRLVSDHKHPLLLKFVQRLSMAHGWLKSGAKVRPAAIKLGPYLPTNLEQVIDRVVKLRGTTPPLISLETAVLLLVEAGMPIDDVAEEIQRIEERDYDSANKLADATNDSQAVRDLLHLEGPPPATTVPAAVVDQITQNLPPPGPGPQPQPQPPAQ